ncbi:MAG: helix-hairpin-helix domain-containing protein [Nitrospirales bacterium]
MKMWLFSVMMLILVLPGCVVSKDKYEAAVSDMESAKAELEKMRMHRDALEQQVKTVKSSNEAVSTDLEMMTAEVQRIKEGRKGEQALVQSRKKELLRKQQQLLAKHKRLAREFQKTKSQNKALKETVVRYQKELKANRQKTMAQVSAPAKVKKSIGSSTQPKGKSIPGKTAPASVKSTPVPASGKKVQLVNINKASASDLILFLGLTKEVAAEVVAKRPYRLRGELVAKQVVPKATFDVIKDRITAAR